MILTEDYSDEVATEPSDRGFGWSGALRPNPQMGTWHRLTEDPPVKITYDGSMQQFHRGVPIEEGR